jgi:hypothetical protein
MVIDEIKLSDALHKRADDPVFSPSVYYGGTDGMAHLAPMQNKVRQYSKAYLQILASLPGREVDYDYAVGAALDFIREERAGAVKVGPFAFKEEFPHTALVYLVEAARLYPARVEEIEALLALALKEMRVARAAA